MNTYFEKRPQSGLAGKLVVLAVLVLVSWVATMFVWGVVEDRQGRQNEATEQISSQWSRPQTIAGPVITIPVEKTVVTPTGERFVDTTTVTLLPRDLAYSSEINTELLRRGVYETPVYTTVVNGAGSFDLAGLAVKDASDTKVRFDQAVVSVNVSDPRGISSAFTMELGDEVYDMLPASAFSTLSVSGVHANVALDPSLSDYQFSFAMPLKGSRELFFLPLGENTNVTLRSGWSAPSFTGEFLPEHREVGESGFVATWQVTSYGKNLPQSWVGSASTVDRETLLSKAFGVGLYQEVNFYTMVDRAIKYSILFISLTFLTFFMYEILAGLRIHPIQYLLVGLAIALFYLLLLSFAEVIGFSAAYIVAAAATTLLITSYCFSVLQVKKRAFSIAALLVALYGYLYVLLQMDQYSLLFGSVLLFGVLATVMYLTRDLDWYGVGGK